MFNTHPKIAVKPTSVDYGIIKIGWLLLALAIIAIIPFYADLPEKIPTHFNHKGVADGFGHKSTIWLLPALNIVLYGGLTLVVIKVKPWKFNYPTTVTEKNAPELYALGIRMLTVINLVVSLVLSAIALVILYAAYHGSSPGVWLILLVLIPVFTPIVYFSYKMMNLPK